MDVPETEVATGEPRDLASEGPHSAVAILPALGLQPGPVSSGLLSHDPVACPEAPPKMPRPTWEEMFSGTPGKGYFLFELQCSLLPNEKNIVERKGHPSLTSEPPFQTK